METSRSTALQPDCEGRMKMKPGGNGQQCRESLPWRSAERAELSFSEKEK